MPASNPPAWRPVWPWVLAVGLVAGSQLFWLLRLQVDAGIAAPAYEPPPAWRVLNTTAARHTDWWERTQVWSPTLFALPDSVGFSEPVRDREIAVRPPIDSPPAMSMQLQERRREGESAYAVGQLDPHQFVRRVAQTVPVVPVDASIPRAASGSGEERGPWITLLESTPERALEHATWPVAENGWGGEPWVADGMLYVNESGVITQAILDMRPTDAAIKNQVLRTLQTWRWSPAASESIVRVEISYHSFASPEGGRHGR